MTTPSRKVGRPATGRTKERFTATIDAKLHKKLKALTRKTTRSFSSVIEELLILAITPR